MIEKGIVDKNDLKFNSDYSKRINQIVINQKNDISDKIQIELRGLFKNSPFQIKTELDSLVNEIVK